MLNNHRRRSINNVQVSTSSEKRKQGKWQSGEVNARRRSEAGERPVAKTASVISETQDQGSHGQEIQSPGILGVVNAFQVQSTNGVVIRERAEGCEEVRSENPEEGLQRPAEESKNPTETGATIDVQNEDANRLGLYNGRKANGHKLQNSDGAGKKVTKAGKCPKCKKTFKSLGHHIWRCES